MLINTKQILSGININVQGTILLGTNNKPCNTNNAGAIQFAEKDFKYCNGKYRISMRKDNPKCEAKGANFIPGEWLKCEHKTVICQDNGNWTDTVSESCKRPWEE